MSHDSLIGRGPKPRPLLWLATLSFWSVIGLLFAFPRLGSDGNTLHIVSSSLCDWWAWGLLTPLIISVDHWLPLPDHKVRLRLLAHVVLAPLFTVGYVFVVDLLEATLRLRPWPGLFRGAFISSSIEGMFWNILIYFLIVGVYQAYIYQQRYAVAELRAERLERAFSQARLNALRMQLDPHFLFNALNTISAQVEREPKLARKMIGHLGDLLRASLESKHRQEIPFEEELDFLQHYLAIQKTRFGEKLLLEINLSPDVRRALVPSLFLQPLVENAIRHGISQRGRGGTISVTAHGVQGRVDIRVLDDGVGLPPDWSPDLARGLGLSSTRQRIIALHAPGASVFALHRRPGGGTEVEISFPMRLTQDVSSANHAA